MQAPLEQTWLAEHAVPQAPQWFGSLRSETQTPLHEVWPAGHVHTPPTQEVPPEHALPQPPQLAESLESETQAPLQAVRPAPHDPPQFPALHT